MRITAALLVATLGLTACHPGTNGQPRRLASAGTGLYSGALVAHPVYQAAFEALRASLESDGELLVARATLARLTGRLELDRDSLPTMAEAQLEAQATPRSGPGSNAAGLALQVLSGEVPSREHADAALRMAQKFERIIEGRARLAMISLRIDLKRIPESETCRASLVATSRWPESLVIMPGPATLAVLRTSLEPRTGVERRDSSRSHLDMELAIEIPANATTSMPIADIPIQVPIGAIATCLRVDVIFTGGTLEEDGEAYPARDLEVQSGERTDIAGWVPATLVEPEELVRIWREGKASLASILERTVRIAPSRYDETLDRLAAVAEIQPIDTFSAIVPSLRWIAQTKSFGRDEGSWRRWLLARLDDRREAGTVFGE